MLIADESTECLCKLAKRITESKIFRGKGAGKRDADLLKPWESHQVLAKDIFEKIGSDYLMKDLEKILSHVKHVYKEHRERMRLTDALSKGARFTDLPIVKRQDTLRSISKLFDSGPCLGMYSPITREGANRFCRSKTSKRAST